MRNNILSLKNIYNLLVMKDYPVEGGSVISGDRKKGMTLTKFWKENLLPQLTEGRYGTNIWKYTGTRNRHTSEICNRSSQLLTYEEYMQEIVALLNVEFLLQQTETNLPERISLNPLNRARTFCPGNHRLSKNPQFLQ